MLSKEAIKIQQAEELNRLIDYVGGQSCLAAQLDIPRQVVFNWVSRGRISASMATEVERKTHGLFVRRDLRPDVATWAEDI